MFWLSECQLIVDKRRVPLIILLLKYIMAIEVNRLLLITCYMFATTNSSVRDLTNSIRFDYNYLTSLRLHILFKGAILSACW